MHRSQQRLIAAGLLAAVVLAAFGGVGSLDFIGLDDRGYVTQNSAVQEGLSLEGLRFAFTSNRLANWHPVTWLSHMSVVQLFGSEPAAHHWANALLHLANTLLLFGLLARVTGATGASFFAAALFGVHPLHVESVAWVSERKDVLSTTFWLLAMHAHARRPGSLWTAVWLLVGLMTKPMLVTLPFALLLFDRWPMGRTEPMKRLVLEKLPLFGVVVVFSGITFWVQQKTGAVQDVEAFPLALRLQNACVSTATYLGKTLWPTDLAIFYPYPEAVATWKWASALVGIAALSAIAWWRRARAPELFTGWFWFLGTLVPVVGIVQVGDQAWADRYAYVPHLGLFAGAVFLVGRWAGHSRAVARGVAAVGAVLVVAGAVATREQVARWRDDRTLFTHTLEVTRDNYKAHDFLAQDASRAGDARLAETHYREAIRLRPDYLSPYNNLAKILLGTGRATEAVALWREAIRRDPDQGLFHENLGAALASTGDPEAARYHFERAVELSPRSPSALFNLALFHYGAGDWRAAFELLCRAVEEDPGFARGRGLKAQIQREHPEASCE